MTIKTLSPSETEKLGEKIGKALLGGEFIELISDLGGGKTQLVRGIARGAGSNDEVQSPSFTISRVYSAPKFEIYHFDFYRIQGADLVRHEILELLNKKDIVVIVEWGQNINEILPDERIKIHISVENENERQLEIEASSQVIKKLQASL